MKRRLAVLLCLVLIPLTQTSADAKETTYESGVLKNVFIETRFGDTINIDLCLPSNDGTTVAKGRFPVIAELSPYVPTGAVGCGPDPTGCTGCVNLFGAAVRKGYVVAQINSPGSGESQGGPWNMGEEGYALRHYDAIEWVAAQKWSTGKIGTIGGSGVGVSQIQTSPYRPPHLTTMIPLYSSGDSFKVLKPGGLRSGTEVLVCSIPGAMVTAQNGVYTPPGSQAEAERMIQTKRDQVLTTSGKFFCPTLDGSWAHQTRDGFWDGLTADLAKVTIPTWIWGSQDDLFSLGTQDDWHTLGSKNKMLTMGFASHAGDYPGFDQTKEALRWFDYHLKGIDTGIKKDLADKRFRYNVFPDYLAKSAKTYPIPSTKYTKFYLNSGSPDPLANGALTLAPPKAAGTSSYVYTPTDGKGFNPFGAGESNDQRLEVGARVSYLFDTVAKDTEVTGPITMKLYASTTASDTDWVGKLIDVAPDGTWTHVPTNGYLKGMFRTYKGDYERQSAIPTGQVVGYDIEFYPTSWMFKKGHRIGVSMASGDVGEIFPNPNPAQITIHHSPQHPSAITLPVIPQ